MPAQQLAIGSLQYVKSRVDATVNGVTPYNPTADKVEFAFTEPFVDPAPSDWAPGSWETEVETTPYGTFSLYFARCLVGPGGAVALVKGLYDCYVRITDNPEVPVLKIGQVQVI